MSLEVVEDDVDTPFATVGATQLQLGVNDDIFGDNSGSLLVQVTGDTASVPEPSSFALLGLGGLGLAFGVYRDLVLLSDPLDR